VMARDQAGLTIALPGEVQIRVTLPPDASGPGDVATVAIRPEKFRILRDGEQADNRVEGQISGQTFLGESLLSQVRLRTGDDVLVRHDDATSRAGYGVGADVVIGWNAADGVVVLE
jgi:ABC-type Fe3+/spermidine/putrescine transport system ATPase subunit